MFVEGKKALCQQAPFPEAFFQQEKKALESSFIKICI
jgi:hypothetical protein